jgi:hypothetical protein
MYRYVFLERTYISYCFMLRSMIRYFIEHGHAVLFIERDVNGT